MVKRLLTIVLLGSMAISVSAQQLPNPTFDAEWVDCHPWEKGHYIETPKGKQPSGWYISNVPDASVIGLSFEVPIVGEAVTGANGKGRGVKLTNVSTSGQNIPAYISLGTTWATAEVKGITQDVRNADGGVFGGIPFIYHPDAVRLTYKCDRSSGNEKMSVIAYLWKGKWTQTNVPSNTAVKLTGYGSATKVTMDNRINNILGKETLTGDTPPTHDPDAALIASVEEYKTEQVDEWTTAEFPLVYKSNATPEMLNIVISANGLFDDRSTIKSGNSVTIDDVELVYWHGLKSLTCNGSTLNFTDGTTNYDFSSVAYDETSFSYVKKGQAASVTKSYDAETAVLTIRVEGEDYDSQTNPNSYTEYTVQFKQPVAGPEVVSSKTYSEDLYVSMAGQTLEKQVADVVVETLDNGNINFVLKNFVLGSGEDAAPIGNIAVNDIEVASDGSFNFNDGIQIVDGDDPAYAEEWAGPYITYKAGGSVPLNLSGCFVGENKDKVVVYISINLESSFGYMVYVHLGYSRATMAVNATAKYGTFCAPFAVEIPETVTASKVTGVGANGLLTLTDLSTTIPANTPVVLFAESGLETVEFFGVAEAGTPKEGLLTGVYEPTDITSGYVLQNQSGEVGFYRVDSKITVPANRCYLTAPAGSVKALSFPDGTQTSISAIQANDEKAVMYDLSGRRVSKATKGIYITNGKKVLVK